MLQKAEAFFRCDANSKIGMGHLIRSSALAEMLRKDFSIHFVFADTNKSIAEKYLDPSFKIHFIDQDPIDLNKLTNPEAKNVIILDGYQFTSDYQEKVKQKGVQLAFIDDIFICGHPCDLIINQAENIEDTKYHEANRAVKLLGLNYVLLRPPFIKAAGAIRNIRSIQNVFVSFGGADADNYTFKVLNCLSAAGSFENIHVLSGPVNENIHQWKDQFTGFRSIHFHENLNAEQVCSIMQTCELAICPASSLSLELCAVGIPMIIGTSADNQNGLYHSLVTNMASLGIGTLSQLNETELTQKIRQLISGDEQVYSSMIQQQRKLIDGRSGERLRSAFNTLLQ